MGVVRTKQPKFPARLSRRSTLLDASVSDAVGIPQFGIGKGVLTLVMHIMECVSERRVQHGSTMVL